MQYEQSGFGQERRRGCLVLIVVLVLLSVVLVGALAFQYLSRGTGLDLLDLGLKYKLRKARGRVLPMPALGDVRSPDLLITNWAPSADSETFFVSYTAQHDKARKVLWEKAFKEAGSWYYPIATFDRERIYYVVESRLLAWNRADGADAWEAPLSDVVWHRCVNCIQRVAGNVVVLTEDYVLQGVDAEDGQEAWTVRLNDSATARSGFYVIDGQIVLLDDIAPDVHDSAVHFYDADDGGLIRQIAPTCPDADDEPRFDADEVFFEVGSARGDRVYFGYTCWGDLYVEVWDLGNGESLWVEALPEEASGIASAMLGQKALYLITYGGLFAVSLDDGQAELLAEEVDPDYDVLLIAERGDTVLARARRTRGSTRYELWGLEPGGKRAWRHEMEADTLLDVDSGIADWGFRFTADGLLIAQVLDDPDRILVETLDVETGQVIRESSVEVEHSSLDDIVWTGQYGFLSVWGDVHAVDLESGTVEAEWP
jgi:hypothetical protein